jgi:21S rRNA (uridine2791-2'-O)-methyltransferase
VAVSKTSPGGRVVGIDILPVQPPRGVSTIQGNFLSERVQEEVRRFVRDEGAGRMRERVPMVEDGGVVIEDIDSDEHGGYAEPHDLDLSPEPSISTSAAPPPIQPTPRKPTLAARDASRGLVVDLLLSDMCAPWPQTSSLHSNSVSNPYRRMANTSGIPFKDHVASMDLCMSALTFAFDTLRTGGGFVCKFFAGAEDKDVEGRMRKLFEKVVREKPEGSRGVSFAIFFVIK